MLSYRLMGLQLSLIELLRRKSHDRFMHAILHLESAYRRRTEHGHEPLHHAHAKPLTHRFLRNDRGRQLTVVTSQDEPLATLQRQPTDRFRTLAGLIDDTKVELSIAEHFAIQ